MPGAKIAEHHCAACHWEHTNVIIANDMVIFADSEMLHMSAENFSGGHRVWQTWIGLCNLAYAKILSVFCQTMFFVLLLSINFAAWKVPTRVNQTQWRASLSDQILDFISFDEEVRASWALGWEVEASILRHQWYLSSALLNHGYSFERFTKHFVFCFFIFTNY